MALFGALRRIVVEVMAVVGLVTARDLIEITAFQCRLTPRLIAVLFGVREARETG